MILEVESERRTDGDGAAKTKWIVLMLIFASTTKYQMTKPMAC
jgi:hypothetical protein